MTGSTDCSVEPVARTCCGPNATHFGPYWCACNPGYGCGEGTPACERQRACKKLAAFHINVPRRCMLGAPQQSLIMTEDDPPVPESRAQCIENNNTIRFIHIDKTGGTSIRKWFEDAFPEPQWQNKLEYPGGMGHLFTLGAACTEDCYAFYVRDPVRRWVSRFLHRKRQAEEDVVRYGSTSWGQALKDFPTPTSLAEALSSTNGTHQEVARHLFQGEIGANKRLGKHYLHRLLGPAKEREMMLNRIVFVGATTSLNEDFYKYSKLVGLPVERLGAGTQGGGLEQHNARPQSQKKLAELSELGKRNAEAELSEDYKVLQILNAAGLISEPCTGTDDCNM